MAELDSLRGEHEKLTARLREAETKVQNLSLKVQQQADVAELRLENSCLLQQLDSSRADNCRLNADMDSLAAITTHRAVSEGIPIF